ncbi:MAG: class I SAM-dependent methyltransferase [Verrucomicrobiae bacterium]|nr:class I SAM-dependent methyltransferase [Verrucomicrobiae bacterium]
MNWRLKSAQFKLLSALPGGEWLYNFIQDHLTHSTAASPGRLANKLDVALDFWRWLQARGRAGQLLAGRLLDYGAGWHPTIPLLWHAFGNDHQTLVDIKPNLTPPNVRDTVRIFRDLVRREDWPGRAWVRRLPELPSANPESVAALLGPLGMEYCAPYGSLLQERAGQYDLVLCTQVLQHVPPAALPGILNEIHTCLRPGGLFHATIHFVGHFGDPFARGGHYEHLIYSPETWERRFNSRLMRFNRLKGPDYRAALEATGFRLLAFDVTPPTEADLAELRRTPVHPSFRRYPEHELAALGVFLVAEKP